MEPHDTATLWTPRVLHLDDGREWRGGQHQVLLLMLELAAMRVPQRLLTPQGSPLGARARERGIEVDTVRFRGELDWSSARQIADIAREFDANLLHAHTAHAHTHGLRARRSLGDGVRLVTTRRVDFPVARGGIGGYFSRRKYLAEDQFYIAISEGVREVLQAGGVAPGRISVVHSGVPAIPADQAWARERVRELLGIPSEQVAIVAVGALTDHKGHRWLIEAMPAVTRSVPHAVLHILGDGELRADLERQLADLKLEAAVRLHGNVEDARLKLAGFDLHVSSSHMEGLGTANIDAMLAGLPVVAAAAGGVTDLVNDGRTGRLVPPRDPQALAGAIIAALTEADETRRMAQAAQRHVVEHFSARSMAEGTLAVYRRLLARI